MTLQEWFSRLQDELREEARVAAAEHGLLIAAFTVAVLALCELVARPAVRW
jgi:Flp pilus assembly pilin Flp